MIDALYVTATIGFFALMLLYVRRCAALGGGTDDRARVAVDKVNADSVVAGVLAAAILVYLVYTLLRPERF